MELAGRAAEVAWWGKGQPLQSPGPEFHLQQSHGSQSWWVTPGSAGNRARRKVEGYSVSYHRPVIKPPGNSGLSEKHYLKTQCMYLESSSHAPPPFPSEILPAPVPGHLHIYFQVTYTCMTVTLTLKMLFLRFWVFFF